MNFLGIISDSEEKKPNTVKKSTEDNKKESRTVHESGVVVEGVDNLMIRLSRCCNPVPGDQIVGYITRGRGISVHREDCSNLQHEEDLQNRLIHVEWEQNNQLLDEYETEIQIIGFDRSGLVNDILHVVNHTVKNLRNVNGRIDDNSQATVTIKVAISNTVQLQDLMSKLNNIPDVYEVHRISS